MRRWRTKGADRRAISFHYDVSNDFYALFLDKRMVYTCAYYRQPDGDLDQAQEDKLDLVCRKLRLAPGERLLDIGCGWGSLVIWAAERYGVEAYGVTLSAEQAESAGSAIRRAGLEGRARVEHLDVEALRAHYARTTRQWVDRLQANAERARTLVGERVYRTWLLYLAASSVSFTQGSIGLYQIVAARPGPAAATALPTAREAIYARAERPALARAS